MLQVTTDIKKDSVITAQAINATQLLGVLGGQSFESISQQAQLITQGQEQVLNVLCVLFHN